MNEEIDDQDFHYDFTAASEWEMFMFRLEEIIREWKIPQLKRGPLLKKGELSTGKWETKTENINFADVEFRLTRHRLLVDSSDDISSPLDEENEESKSQVLEDIMRFEHDFPPHSMDNGTPQPHPLAVWYGIRDFLVLSAWSGISSYSESKVKILLSSIYVAVNNSNCPIPLFVQVHETAEHYYLGVCEARGLRTEFEMIHLKRTPPHCKYLTGLLNVFKSKITSAMSTEPVTISVQFTYILTDWTSNKWTQEPPDFDFLNGQTLGVKELGKLPFGATFDPVSELQLYARWPQLAEAAVVDSESYSDLEPCRAPEWSVGVRMVERPNCLLGEHFDEFLQFCLCKSTARDLLGDMIDVATAENINLSSSLSAITESRVPTISKVIRKAKVQHQLSKGGNRDAPLSHDYLLPILYFLFPDADSKLENPYAENIGSHSSSDNRQEEQLLNIKSAPVDSLVWRLAIVMSHVVHTLGGIRAAAYLWFEFTQEMRYRWDKCILIPGVAPGDPDLRTCLLHQKLQMLNRCIERRLAREREARATSVDTEDTDTESDEEFFDCSADAPAGAGGGGDRPRHSLWNRPAGRLSRHPQLRLLRTGEPLYVPVTQQHTPKTEDQQQEDEDVLVQLGTDERAAQLRARIMSAALLSDMECFKAANPGAVLEDFIRWYSPPDWKEEDGVDEFGQKKGCLSVRMQLKGNPWVEAWEAAKPVPARRQKRLFDDTREAEKVLHWLEAARPADVGRLLLAPLSHAAAVALLSRAAQQPPLPRLPPLLASLGRRAERLSRAPHVDVRDYEKLSHEIASAEALMAQARSLMAKFCGEDGGGGDGDAGPSTSSGSGPDPGSSTGSSSSAASEEARRFVYALLQAPRADLPGGPRGLLATRVRAFFAEAHKASHMLADPEVLDEGDEPWSGSGGPSAFPQPARREFILRAVAPRPSPCSQPAPHKMCAVLQRHDFRIAACFTLDTTFH
ncbi:rab3 GTPase-activating protein catalytic subunit [Schistocerca americana]|uniref:rab3 GTPase-activating protein catalytic subunit n=1 Tax=Schistocerca americana TaxID=7009 RepID=UPI001F4F9304|nr:rab3 GTPase-activating protein catalytic subunit [Schistocerca americana]